MVGRVKKSYKGGASKARARHYFNTENRLVQLKTFSTCWRPYICERLKSYQLILFCKALYPGKATKTLMLQDLIKKDKTPMQSKACPKEWIIVNALKSLLRISISKLYLSFKIFQREQYEMGDGFKTPEPPNVVSNHV